MKKKRSGFMSDVRVAVEPVSGLLLAIGSVLVLSSWTQWGGDQQLRLLYAAMPFLFVAGAAWFLSYYFKRLTPGFIVVALDLGIGIAAFKLQMPELLVATAVVTVLTAGLFGVIPAAANAALMSLASIALARWLPPSSFIVVTLALHWTLWGAMIIIYRPVDQLGAWLWRYFQQAREMTLAAREQRMQLTQSLEDYKHASRQLALAGERATALRQAAEVAEQAKAQFVSRVSHELRAPLNIIIGLVGLMVENPTLYAEELPPDLRHDLDIVHRNCRHLSSLVNDVLDLSRTEAGRMPLHPEDVDITGLIQDTLAIVRPLAEKKGLELQTTLPEDVPRIRCDPVRIRQVLLNLVSNAVRFTDAGHVDVHLAVEARRLRVSVSDTGPGIAAEEIERIFEPFYQTGQHREQTGSGSGLGLSISKELIERHGGQIWIESTPGAGTRFSFDLPLITAQEHRARAGHQIVPDWVWRERAFRTDHSVSAEELVRPRWLVYDEAGGLLHQLTHHTDNVEFVEVSSLAEATKELARTAAHGVLINAPEPARLLHRLQEARATIAGVPLIGCGVAPLLQRAFEAGAQGYLLKPVRRAELDAMMASIEGRVRQVLVVDDEPESARVLAQQLEARDPTLTVHVAHDGAQALKQARAHRPDAILLDVIMPRMDGWQTLRAIRALEELAEIPVYFVSAQNPEGAPPRSTWLAATVAHGITIEDLVHSALNLAVRLRR